MSRTPDLHSALYTGAVRHRRFAPVTNEFTYTHTMAYLDLAELPTLFAREPLVSLGRPNLAWFRRADYLGDPAVPLDRAVGDLVVERTGTRPSGPIRMLTTLRQLGYAFNPVTFYYCFDAAGERVDTIVAEITNTPWLERHAYVLPREAGEVRGGRRRFRFPKAFHVSPFLPMDLEHVWRFTDPGERLHVHMEDRRDGELVLDATLALTRVPLGARRYTQHVLRHPLATLKVTAGIYLQALRLWWKRCPFHPHPRRAQTRAERHPHAHDHAPDRDPDAERRFRRPAHAAAPGTQARALPAAPVPRRHALHP